MVIRVLALVLLVAGAAACGGAGGGTTVDYSNPSTSPSVVVTVRETVTVTETVTETVQAKARVSKGVKVRADGAPGFEVLSASAINYQSTYDLATVVVRGRNTGSTKCIYDLTGTFYRGDRLLNTGAAEMVVAAGARASFQLRLSEQGRPDRVEVDASGNCF